MEHPDLGTLAATKLQPPTVPRHLVRRERLDALLDRAITDRHRLILLCAPAGSGKSTLLAGSLTGRDERLTWLQVEDSDADPVRFWSHLAASIERVRPGTATSLLPVVVASGGEPEAVVTALVNILAADDQPLVTVIDDYHLVDNGTVHRGVERLVELAPEHVRVVIATRSDPPFRVGRLRVRAQLTEIRSADLRFGPQEAVALLSSTSLDESQLVELCSRTEGWAAGLVLAGLSLTGVSDPAAFIEGFRGNDQLVVDYLTDELLAAMSAHDRRRHLETSILDRLTGPLVDAVTGSTDGTAWLHDTARSNQLLIGLDRTGTAFRYHHLLRDLLRLEASREFPDRLPALHRAAADWHHEHGDMFAAIGHYISAGELETAGDLIAVHATTLLNGGQIFTVLRLLDRLGDLPERHSRSALVKGWIDLTTGRFAGARHYYEIADRLDDGTDAGLKAALGIMVHLSEGDLATALTLADRLTEPTESTQVVALAAARTWSGQFDLARDHVAVARELGSSEPSDYAASSAPGLDAVIALATGHTELAAKHATESIDHASGHRVGESPHLAVPHAIVARTTTDPDRREAAAERALDLARRAPDPFRLGYVLTTVGDVWSERGDHRGVVLLTEARSVIGRCADPGIVGSHLRRVEARHAIAEATPETGLVDDLTEREIAVLRYLPSPLSLREISAELFVSLNTVKTHCRSIYRKLAVGDRKAAVHAARRLDLL